MPAREPLLVFLEEHQTIDELAHGLLQKATESRTGGIDLSPAVNI
jgi:hypothetical protein